MSGPKWTDADTRFVAANWQTMSDEQIAGFLNRPVNMVEKKRVEMNLCRKKRVRTVEVRIVRDNRELRACDFDDFGIPARRAAYLRSDYIRHAP